ncbi:hypothetical protein [Ureaplasma ceti]
MIPANGAISFNDYVNSTGFYAVKYSSDFSSYSISLTSSGIGIIIWSFICLIVYALTGASHALRGKYNRQLTKETGEKKSMKERAPGLVVMVTFLFFLSVTFILFVFMLVIPNVAEIAKMHHAQQEIQTALAASSDSNVQPLIDLCNKYKIAHTDNTYGVLRSALTSYNPLKTVWFTPFYNWEPTQFAVRKTSIDAGIVLFSLALIFLTLAWLISLKMKKNLKKVSAEEKVSMKDLIAQYKAAKQERKVLKQNKKELLAKENELLKNLYEIDKDLNTNNSDNLTPIQKINQQELEEKLAKNNELKKQLEELAQRKAELKKQSISNSKIKSALNKAQENNSRVQRNKKQEIAVPDQELEEIFKSLDID